jgi:eukaryotic-like serine/threonine-protein kinase
MYDDELIDTLIAWDALRSQGKPVPIEQLCSNLPIEMETIREYAARIEATAWMMDSTALQARYECTACEGDELDASCMDSSRDPMIGVEVGCYQLLRRIGCGGMGDIYAASRTAAFQHVVAVKLMRWDVQGPERRDRIERERQLLAELQHPNICHILDGGEMPDGRPYIVMELIDGQHLDLYCEAHDLSVNGRIALFKTLCIAVQYAHAKGIIHRDLKPSNVLVDELGTLRVTDFGLARRVDRRDDEVSLTHTEQIVGTPSYMSPEQARGSRDVCVASDIYSLGAILYRLLSGRPPFRGANSIETISQVVRDSPVPLRRILPKLQRDLETIVMRCIEKIPNLRFASVQELIEDLERFELGRPIRSRPIAWPEKIKRWCIANPTTAILVGALVATASAAGFFVTYQWRASENARHNAEQNEIIAHRMSRAALQLSEKLLTSPDLSETQLPFFEQTLAAYQDLASSPTASPSTQFELTQTHHFIGRLYGNRGQYAQARKAFLQQLDGLGRLLVRSPNDTRYKYDQFFALHSIADSYRLEDNLSEQDEYDERASEALHQLMKLEPENPIYADALAAQWNIAAGKFQGRWDLEASDAKARQAFEIADELIARVPKRTEAPFFELQASQAKQILSLNAVVRSEFDAALQFARDATAIVSSLRERITADAELEFSMAYNDGLCGRVFADCEHWDEARNLLQQSTIAMRAANSRLPNENRRRKLLSKLESIQAWVEWNSGDIELSKVLFDRTIRDAIAWYDTDSGGRGEQLVLLHSLSSCPFADLRNLSRIEEMVQALAPQIEGSRSEGDWRILAMGHLRLGQLDEARRCALRCNEVSPVHNSLALRLLAKIEADAGNSEKSLSLLEQASARAPATIASSMDSMRQECLPE